MQQVATISGTRQQNGALGLRVSSLSEANFNTAPGSSPSDKWINFEVAYDDDGEGEMMQNDAPPEPAPLAVVPLNRSAVGAIGGSAPGPVGDDFRQVMHQLEELKEKPLFSEDELEEATEEDDLFDDEDYDLEEVIRRHRQKLEESRQKAGFVDDEDDDYYDDYSAEEDEEERKRARTKQTKEPAGSAIPHEGDDSVMQDYLSNIKSKSAPHRFKSKFDDFDDGTDGEGTDLLSGGGGSSSSRKLRKNDSIKIISTPNGKVGIVYKVEPKATEDETGAKGVKLDGASGGSGSAASGGSDHRQNKITPVITADGKVALLYRGASDNGDTFRNKYEPITAKDILQLIDNNNNSNNGSTASVSAGGDSVGSSSTNNSIKNITNNNIYNSHKHYDNSYDSFNRNINKQNVIVGSDRSGSAGDDSRENNAALGGLGPAVVAAFPWATTTPMSRSFTTSTAAPSSTATADDPPVGSRHPHPLETGDGLGLPDRQENSLLINRPLSEVLGIRKNQYLETNTIKIPNIETSTNKMRITNTNNLLSSLLHNLYHHPHHHGGVASNGTGPSTTSDDRAEYHNSHAGRLAEEEHRRAGYSVNGFSRSRFYINRRTTPALPPRIIKEEESEEVVDTLGADGSDNALPELVNLAIIPAFEHEIDEKYIRPSHGGGGDLHRRHRHQYNVAPGQPAVHCAMQALVACAVMATFFGIVGTYFRSRVVDHIRVLYW